MNYLEKIPEEAVLKFHINYGNVEWFDTFLWTYFHKVYNIGYVAVVIEGEDDPSSAIVTVEVGGIHYLPINKHPNSDTSQVVAYKNRSRSMSPDITVQVDAIGTSKITYGWWRVKVNVDYHQLTHKPKLFVPAFRAEIEVVE